MLAFTGFCVRMQPWVFRFRARQLPSKDAALVFQARFAKIEMHGHVPVGCDKSHTDPQTKQGRCHKS